MAELTNTGVYAVWKRWSFPGPGAAQEEAISGYLERVARLCEKRGVSMVGHIKALALFPDGQYFRVSVVSPALPAEKEGNIPDDCTALELAVNVIVYGLDRNELKRIVGEAAADLMEARKGSLNIEDAEGL